jgi:hypothetical protein
LINSSEFLNYLESENLEIIKTSPQEIIDFEELKTFFNMTCKKMPSVQKITDTRKRQIIARAKEYSIETIKDVFTIASSSDFLNGESGKKWVANFDWLMNPTNFLKVIEKNYENRVEKSSHTNGRLNYDSDFD